MALKQCPDCGTSVSSSAITCPKCGRNLAAYRSHWWALAILAVMVAAAAFSLSTPAQAQQIYRCVGLDGRTTFSQQACPDGAAGEAVTADNPPPSNGSDYIPYGDIGSLPAPRERPAPSVNVVGGQKRCSTMSSQEIRRAIVQKKILVGMTSEEAIRSWGRPIKINRSSHGPDQWVYGYTYLYIEDGCVVSWN